MNQEKFQQFVNFSPNSLWIWIRNRNIAFDDLKGHGGGLLVKSEVPHAVVPLHVVIVDHDHEPGFVIMDIVHISTNQQGD